MLETEGKAMTIERLPGVKYTPELFLNALLENKDDIESIVAVVKWTNGERQTCCTTLSDIELAAAAIHIQAAATREMIP